MQATDNRTLRTFLAKCRVFQGLNEIEIATLTGLGLVESYEEGDLIMKQGSAGDSFYVILTGSAEVKKLDKAGRQSVVIAHLNRGDVFGEIALAQHRPRTATVVVIDDDSKLIRFTFQDFEKLEKTMPETAKHILDNIKKIISERAWAM
jgi:CRP-like cAMP-binding protein